MNMELTKEQIGYIAGIVDGEGTITLTRRRSKILKRKNRKPQYNLICYAPAIYVGNTNLDLILWLKSKLGCGSIYIWDKGTDKHKPVYRITFSANMVRKILPIIIDSLIVKKSQAVILKEFLRI